LNNGEKGIFTMKGLIAIGVLFSALTVNADVIELKFDSNVSTRLRQQVMTDFELIQSMASTRESPIHSEIFGKIEGANYLQWFQNRVKFFGFNNCGGPSAVACVKPQYLNKIFVTGNYTGINHPQIARLMTLYHEARHTERENGNWSHAKCPSNFPYRSIWTGKRLNGNYACDATVYGSYASASVMLNNISRHCETCSEKTKQDAKLYSDDQVKRVVDKTAAEKLKADFES
jgi:hypothetical protein